MPLTFVSHRCPQEPISVWRVGQVPPLVHHHHHFCWSLLLHTLWLHLKHQEFDHMSKNILVLRTPSPKFIIRKNLKSSVFWSNFTCGGGEGAGLSSWVGCD